MKEIATEGICFRYNRSFGDEPFYPYAVSCKDRDGNEVIIGYFKKPTYLLCLGKVTPVLPKPIRDVLEEVGAKEVHVEKHNER